jgi:hypothetical protein
MCGQKYASQVAVATVDLMSASDHLGTTDSVSSSVSYAVDHRPWFEKWWLVTIGLSDISRLYSGDLRPPETSHYRAVVSRFCSDSWDMKDWLFHDDTRVPPSDRADADNWRRSSAAIQLTGDVANTFKHRTRTGGRPAGVSQVGLSGYRPQIAVAWWDPATGAVQGSRDALDLAQGAVDDWRAFFTAHGMTAPY